MNAGLTGAPANLPVDNLLNPALDCPSSTPW
jgi:hypothetical protein